MECDMFAEQAMGAICKNVVDMDPLYDVDEDDGMYCDDGSRLPSYEELYPDSPPACTPPGANTTPSSPESGRAVPASERAAPRVTAYADGFTVVPVAASEDWVRPAYQTECRRHNAMARATADLYLLTINTKRQLFLRVEGASIPTKSKRFSGDGRALNPFCHVAMGESVLKTKVVKGTSQPVWNMVTRTDISRNACARDVSLTVKSHRRLIRHQALGCARLSGPLLDASEGVTFRANVPLQDPKMSLECEAETDAEVPSARNRGHVTVSWHYSLPIADCFLLDVEARDGSSYIVTDAPTGWMVFTAEFDAESGAFLMQDARGHCLHMRRKGPKRAWQSYELRNPAVSGDNAVLAVVRRPLGSLFVGLEMYTPEGRVRVSHTLPGTYQFERRSSFASDDGQMFCLARAVRPRRSGRRPSSSAWRLSIFPTEDVLSVLGLALIMDASLRLMVPTTN
eukprot:Opistho-1_new@22202